MSLLNCRCLSNLFTGPGIWGSFLGPGVLGDLGISAACGVGFYGLSMVGFIGLRNDSVFLWQCLKPWAFLQYFVIHLAPLSLNPGRPIFRMIKLCCMPLFLLVRPPRGSLMWFLWLSLCLNCPSPTHLCLKWYILSWTIPTMVTFHPIHVAMQPLVHGCVLCVWPSLRTMTNLRSFPISCFIVPRPLPTMWSAGTRPPTDS